MHKKTIFSRIAPYFALALAVIFWSISWSNGRVLAVMADAKVIAFWRFFINTLIFLPIFFRHQLFVVGRNGIKTLFLGSCAVLLYNFFLIKGLSLAQANYGSFVVTSFTPVFTFSISIIFLSHKLLKIHWFGLFLAILGTMIMMNIFEKSWRVFLDFSNIFFVLAAFFWALITIFAQKFSPFGSALAYNFYSLLLSAFGFLVLNGAEVTGSFLLEIGFWVHILSWTFISTMIGTTLYFWGVSKVGGAVASSFIYLLPFTASLGSFFILDEHLTSSLILGGLVSVVGVFFLNQKPRHL